MVNRGNLFPETDSLSCSSNDGYACVDVVCSNAHASGGCGVVRTISYEELGSTLELVLGKQACSRQVPELVHSKGLVQEQVHSKVLVQVLEHSMGLELALVHSKGLVLEQVHNKVQVLEQVHSKVLEPVQVHSKVPELEYSKAQELGKLACSNAGASGGCEVARTSSHEELGSIESHMGPGSNRFHG